MSKVTVVFLGGDSNVDKIIDTVTTGDLSHVAMKILGGTLESLGMKDSNDKYPGVWLHNASKYDNNSDVQFIEVDLPDLPAAEKKAKLLLGRFYSYIGCVEGGIYDLFGVQLHPWITKIIHVLTVKFLGLPVNIDTGEWTMNCSETVSRILRAGGINVLPDVDADCITPMDLVRWFVNNGYELKNKKGAFMMSEETVTTTTTEETTTSTAAAAVALASSATATAQVINATVTKIAAKIEELANEIKTTSSSWVKIRNTVEIGALSVLLSKAASAVSEKIKD